MIKKGDIIDLNIESLSYGGLGIAHYNDIVVFVKGALPGQSVKSKIFRKKKKYLEAYVLEIIKESTDYVEPLCEHFGTCGGCLLQNYNYKKQLDEKQNQIKDLFSRIAKVETPQIKSIIGCEDQYYYRNKMEFSYSPNRWVVDLESIENEESNDALGLHVKGRFDKIIDINDCHLHGEKSNTIFKFLKEYLIKNKISSFDIKKRTGYLKNIIIRQGYQTDEILINFITTSSDDAILSKLIESLTKKFKSIKSIINTVVKNNSGSSIGEEKILWGENYINDNIGKYTFKISSNSFFQTNTKQSELLYKEIKNICDLKGDEIVYDLYCGTGSIGIYIAEYVKMVYGVEIVMDAVIDAIENAQKNNIKNI